MVHMRMLTMIDRPSPTLLWVWLQNLVVPTHGDSAPHFRQTPQARAVVYLFAHLWT